MEVLNRSGLDGAALGHVQRALATCRSLEQVYHLAHTQIPGASLVRLSSPDGLTEDILVLRGASSQVLAFAVEPGGRILGLTIYDRMPTPAELTESRRTFFLAPTAS